jgi:hypothetical protein
MAGRGHLALNSWYRHRKQARERAALAHREAVLDRMRWQVEELRTHLDRCAAMHAVIRAELDRPVPFVW